MPNSVSPKSRWDWEDPQYPDIDRTKDPRGVWFCFKRKIKVIQALQAARGLPRLEEGEKNIIRKGRDRMTLTFWDKACGVNRTVVIWADIVMNADQWNNLHPGLRRLVPHRLLPPAALTALLIDAPGGDDPTPEPRPQPAIPARREP